MTFIPDLYMSKARNLRLVQVSLRDSMQKSFFVKSTSNLQGAARVCVKVAHPRRDRPSLFSGRVPV